MVVAGVPGYLEICAENVSNTYIRSEKKQRIRNKGKTKFFSTLCGRGKILNPKWRAVFASRAVKNSPYFGNFSFLPGVFQEKS